MKTLKYTYIYYIYWPYYERSTYKIGKYWGGGTLHIIKQKSGGGHVPLLPPPNDGPAFGAVAKVPI